MSSLLTEYSKFYFGFVVTDINYQLDFKEGVGPELTAELNIGEYSLTDFVDELKRAFDDAGALTYTVSVDRDTRFITISAGSTFSLLVSSGSHLGNDGYPLMGFTTSDRTGASTYTGDSPAGSEYKPQFKLQSYISSDNWQQAADSSINKMASGRVEIVKFGTEKFLQFQIKFITDIDQGCIGPIRNNPDGLEDIQEFMQFIVNRTPIEFMPDEGNTSLFQTLIFEASPDVQTGTGYKLKELYDQNLPGYFETAILKFRLIE